VQRCSCLQRLHLKRSHRAAEARNAYHAAFAAAVIAAVAAAAALAAASKQSSHTVVQMVSISPRLIQSFPGSLNVVALAVVVAVLWCGECALMMELFSCTFGQCSSYSPCDLHVVSASMYNQGHFDISNQLMHA
jgi:hypothetical protein